jgi:hypothetical protein
LVIREQKLPNQQLFNGIKSCSSWLECSQLLARNADRMDAMLLSTLVTQTVSVKSGPVKSCNQQLLHPQKQPQEHIQPQDAVQGSISPGNSTGSNPSRVAVAAVADSTHGSTTGSSGTTSNRTTSSSTETSNSSSSSSTHKQRLLQDSPDGRSTAASFWVYMRQLAHLALQLCETFRPQQFSNVLWGLAKCGLRPPSSWIDSYLGQVSSHMQLAEEPSQALPTWVALALTSSAASTRYTLPATSAAGCCPILQADNPAQQENEAWQPEAVPD